MTSTLGKIMLSFRSLVKQNIIVIAKLSEAHSSRLWKNGEIRTYLVHNNFRWWNHNLKFIQQNSTNINKDQTSIKETLNGKMPKRQLSLKQTSSVVPSLWQVLPNWIPSQISLSILLLMKHVSRRSLLHLSLLDFVQKELFWLEIKSNCQQQHSQAIHLKLVIAEVCSKDC